MVEKGQNPKIKIAIVAGEKSGDELGAPLMQSLKSLNPSIEFVGVGGSKMISEGPQISSLNPLLQQIQLRD